MYWLLDSDEKLRLRNLMGTLVQHISVIQGTVQDDQLFPFVGRKDLRKATAVIQTLSNPDDLVVDPFSGSGIFTYAVSQLDRRAVASEWEPYTWRMSTAPWRLPDEDELDLALKVLHSAVDSDLNELYSITCDCGHPHVLDSQFFDREPLEYVNVTPHERLGKDGRTITYRGKHRCPQCGATEKYCSEKDLRHLEDIQHRILPEWASDLFQYPLIENSRINISRSFTTYGALFPKRSQLALAILWEGIRQLCCSRFTQEFLMDALLSILPQAKYKDYRSKSQDLHVPERQLREVNLLFRFNEQVKKRWNGISRYSFASSTGSSPIACTDFRKLLEGLDSESVQLLFTDPPWTDGNAYFEKAQLYHPWLEYNLADDAERLENEVVVTDAPSRQMVHGVDRWWSDLRYFLQESSRVLAPGAFLAIYFRPIPASQWLPNVNRIKLYARAAGFEPLLTVDAASKDPSMRIQQSASFVFSSDLIFVFYRLPAALRRLFVNDYDIDYLVFRSASDLQQEIGPFTYEEWQDAFRRKAIAEGIPDVLTPKFDDEVVALFARYTRQVDGGRYLTLQNTPFSGQLFDVPIEERLFAFVPSIVDELCAESSTFSYDEFLLKLAAFVENGTRMLIQKIQRVDVVRLLQPYAEPLPEGKLFRKRSLPKLPNGIRRLMDLDPAAFETFVGQLFEAQGYSNVAVMGGAGDRGVDVVALDPDGCSVVIQCKRYLNNVSAEPIQRLHSFSVTRGAKRRIVVTTAGFTRQAEEEAEKTQTELIDGDSLELLVQQYLPTFLEQ